jgi:hypothetical protein
VTRPNVIAVRSALVKEVLVAEIADAVQERLGTVLLAEAFDPEDACEEALALARAGYATRIVERELFEAARRTAPELEERALERTDQLGDRRAAIADLSRELASLEPLGRPDPEGGAASWKVPGPGGHVRHYVALELGRRLAGTGTARKRDFLFGFFVCWCEEVLSEPPRSPR